MNIQAIKHPTYFPLFSEKKKLITNQTSSKERENVIKPLN